MGNYAIDTYWGRATLSYDSNGLLHVTHERNPVEPIKEFPMVANQVVATVESNSHPGTFHYIRLDKNGNPFCDCEGFGWRQTCSHLEEVARLLNGDKGI